MLVHARSCLQRDVARGCFLHTPGYDVNDEILAFGASTWATPVERELAKGGW